VKRTTVIGSLGWVGLVTAAGLAELGQQVVGVDVVEEKIQALLCGQLPFYEPGLGHLIESNRQRGRLSFTSSLEEALRDSDIVFITVGTPSQPDGQTDSSQILAVAKDLGKFLKDYTIVVIKSTVPLRVIESFLGILKECGLSEGTHFDLVYSPEFLREGSAVNDFLEPSRIVIGGRNPTAVQRIRDLHEPLACPVVETTLENAVMIKYAANAYLATRISFINEIANICEHVGADVKAVIQGIGLDRRIGQDYLHPGLGFGGPCLQKDLSALIHMAESHSYVPCFLKAALEKNAHQVERILAKARAALGEEINGKVVAALGLAFKPRTSDVRNSLALAIIAELQRAGARIQAYDPQAMEAARSLLNEMKLCSSHHEACKGAHLLLILCSWEEFHKLDLNQLRAVVAQPVIVDGVNALNPEQARAAGFQYQGVGRR